ncbi:hypothetical protein V9T40_005783 [Parthenolecanium corni]|uniref:Serpin domain-containing protein n=1 Tax=Parthenolecanium corni TaxID=536013 RepID=A0AAN9TTH2_9HEMI
MSMTTTNIITMIINMVKRLTESEKELSADAATLKNVFKKDDKPGFSYANASLAVGVFAQKDFPVRQEYVDDVQKSFLTKVENLDFRGNEATDTINKFASDYTKGRIPKLFPSPLDADTKLVLVSTLYFHGVWKNDFLEANTKLEKFNTGTKDIEVPMMKDIQFVPYHHNHELQFEAIQIPYFDEDYVMSIVLPHKTQTLMNLTHYLNGHELHATFQDSTTKGVEYKIPKMKIKWAKSLKSVLEKEGLKTIFEKPDFSKLTPVPTLTVTDVYHVAEIEVEEKGTVASAATAVKFPIETKITSLALKLLRNLYNDSNPENVIFSPLNLFTAFGLCHLGALGVTQKEVSNFMELPENEELTLALHQNISSAVFAVKNVEKTTIHSVNGMFVEKLIPLRTAFLANVKKYYNSDVVHVDFEHGGYAATNYINKWISEETKNRIHELFRKPLSSSTKAVIASSVYFSANWAFPFKDYMTQEDQFNTGFENVSIATMRNKKEVRYIDYEAASFEAIALPYDGDEFFMYFLLPYANQTIKNLTNNLTADELQAIIANMNESFAYVDYKIPKTKLKRTVAMSEHLKRMGVQRLFTNANFSNMVQSMDLNLSEITHAAEIGTDEKGTVASGVSTLEYEVYSEYVSLAEPVKFYVDKPFVFFVTHVRTSIPIFFGLVHNPKG